MQASAGGNNNNNETINKTKLSSSPCNFIPPKSPPPKNSMEEVWKDITLTSLTDHRTTATTTAATTNNPGTNFSNIVLQDFLAKPFNKESKNSGGPPSAPPLSLPSFASDFECTDIGIQNHRVSAPYFEDLGFPPFCKKRVQEINENFRDRRHKRMMKNRESAARSRARKQAYTNELELEIAHLQEENARLKRQQEKLLSAPTQLPKKNTIQRSLEAPF